MEKAQRNDAEYPGEQSQHLIGETAHPAANRAADNQNQYDSIKRSHACPLSAAQQMVNQWAQGGETFQPHTAFTALHRSWQQRLGKPQF